MVKNGSIVRQRGGDPSKSLIWQTGTRALAAGGDWLQTADLTAQIGEKGILVERLIVELIPLACQSAVPGLPGFKVGAVA